MTTAILVLACIGMGAACRNSQEEAARTVRSGNKLSGLFFRSIWTDSAGVLDAKVLLAIVIYFEKLGCMPCLNSLRELSDALRRDQGISDQQHV
ncbi:MAG TPA: hypothetical protein VGR15_01050, partial [Bacteroidota bacterium]|nr:hypothetical protein [Bacteroidota bacterium]